MKTSHAAPQAHLPHQSACFSVDEAADQLRIGRSKVYDLIKQGSLVSIKIGRRRLVPAASIHALVEQLYGASLTA